MEIFSVWDHSTFTCENEKEKYFEGFNLCILKTVETETIFLL